MSQKSESYANGFAESAAPCESSTTESMSKESTEKKDRQPVVIKKYANRRLYNTDTSTYVTLDDLATMVRSERDFVVYDARTGEDLTHSVLTQIIVEQESKGTQNLLPIGFLRQLIRFYGNSMGSFVPSYLEYSMDTLTREQEKYRQQFAGTFGSAAIEAIQEQTRKNLEIFQRALSMFSPFTSFEPTKAPAAAKTTEETRSEQAEEIAKLKSQLTSIQSQLDRLADQNNQNK